MITQISVKGLLTSKYTSYFFPFSCIRLGLVSLAYLWRRDQGELLQEMIDCHINAIIIKVAAMGLDPSKHLGMKIADMKPHLVKMVCSCESNCRSLHA